MTNAQLEAAKEVLEPLLMIYRLQGYKISWYIENDPFPREICKIAFHSDGNTYSICIDLAVDKCGRYSCKNFAYVSYSKLRNLPKQVNHHLHGFHAALGK